MNPFSQTRKIPAVIEEHALEHDLVYVNGGKRGLQVRLHLPDLVSALNATVVRIVAQYSSSAERLHRVNPRRGSQGR